MKDLGLVAARGVRLMGPDGLYEEEVLKAGTCDAALGTEMRITFASLPFEKMKGVGGTTYENYKKKYSKEPTAYALYSVEVGPDRHRRHQARCRRHREGRGRRWRSARPSGRPSPALKNSTG